MQIQLDDIGGGERALGQVREEELVNDAGARHTDLALLLASWMDRHHHPARHALRSHRHVGAVVEATCDLAFRTALVPIGGQVQARLDERMIEHGVVFAAHHKRESCQIGDDGSRAILPIQPEQGTFLREMMRLQIAPDGPERLTQFLPIQSVAFVASPSRAIDSCGPG